MESNRTSQKRRTDADLYGFKPAFTVSSSNTGQSCIFRDGWRLQQQVWQIKSNLPS